MMIDGPYQMVQRKLLMVVAVSQVAAARITLKMNKYVVSLSPMDASETEVIC